MRSDFSFTVSAADRRRSRAIVANPGSPRKFVWRARIVLPSGDGLGTCAILAATAKSGTCVWRWQERFMHERVDEAPGLGFGRLKECRAQESCRGVHVVLSE